jgi:hypothetical protein
MKLKDDFVGTGPMINFCKEANALFSAVNNISFTLPSGYEGIEPRVYLEESRLVFDFGDALIFTLNNVVWNLTGSASFSSYTATVISGRLVISVNAESVA